MQIVDVKEKWTNRINTVTIGATSADGGTRGKAVKIGGHTTIPFLAFEGETIIHGKPSGVDNTVSTYGGVISYERGAEFKRHVVEGAMPFIIGDTMRKRSTRMMVEKVAALKERNPEVVDYLLGAMADLSVAQVQP